MCFLEREFAVPDCRKHNSVSKIANIKSCLLRCPMKVKEVIKLLEAGGWVQVRQTGSHRQYTKPGARRPIPVAGKLSDEVPKGTLSKILREAGLK